MAVVFARLKYSCWTYRHSLTTNNSLQTPPNPTATMVTADKKLALHVAEILGLVICAHHFWPKGITYGEQEDWEKAYRRKHGHASRSKSKRERNDSNGSSSSRSEQPRRREGERERSDRYQEYGDRHRLEDRRDRDSHYEDRRDRYYEDREEKEKRPQSMYVEERPVYSRRASSRY